MQGELALQALGGDQPAHDGQAEATDSAGDGSHGCALGPDEAVGDGDDSRPNEHAHEQVHVPAATRPNRTFQHMTFSSV